LNLCSARYLSFPSPDPGRTVRLFFSSPSPHLPSRVCRCAPTVSQGCWTTFFCPITRSRTMGPFAAVSFLLIPSRSVAVDLHELPPPHLFRRDRLLAPISSPPQKSVESFSSVAPTKVERPCHLCFLMGNHLPCRLFPLSCPKKTACSRFSP